jgi:hypothetical protein
LTKAVCDTEHKIIQKSVEQEDAPPFPTALLEQIVVDIKICTQSIVWGIRSGILTGRPMENSFYTSLKADVSELKRLDVLLAEIIELATFLDDGDGVRRPAALPDAPRAFKFTLLELRNALTKCSEALAGLIEQQMKEEEQTAKSEDVSLPVLQWIDVSH